MVVTGRQVLNAEGYRLIAKSLGRALAYIQQDMGVPAVPMAFRVTVDALIADFKADNHRFDESRFRAVLDAAMLGEYEERQADPAREGYNATPEIQTDDDES